jgi:hypothetical protein
MTDIQQERAARNQAVFRDVNERIADITEAQDEASGDILCECDDLACADRIRVSLDEYERVRAHGDRFLILRGHQNEDVEDVVSEHERYLVVEKIERGAVVAHELDPRSGR